MIDIGFAGAILGGLLTILSPCSVMLLPAFFAYAFSDPGQLLSRTGIFYLGLSAALVPLGVLAGTLGSLVTAHRDVLITAGAVIVIALGLLQLSGLPLPGTTTGTTDVEGTSRLAVFVLGTVYGLMGSCTGPILGSVLTLSALGGSALYGGLVLAVFALGMTLPLFLLAFLWSRFHRLHEWLRPREIHLGPWHSTWTQVIAGVASIVIGVLLLATKGLASWSPLDASTQLHVETWAMRATASVPDLLVLGVAVLAVTAIIVARTVYRRRRPTLLPSGKNAGHVVGQQSPTQREDEVPLG